MIREYYIEDLEDEFVKKEWMELILYQVDHNMLSDASIESCMKFIGVDLTPDEIRRMVYDLRWEDCINEK